MKPAKPKKCKGWKAEPLMDRLMNCRTMLAIHGLLSEAENRRVFEQIVEMAKAAGHKWGGGK